ncbi:MerR family transcriptional regulator [Robinsoniella peoriensis]|uniref:HTH-type transcriptional activator TipA n=1 Tax=Robinsoniella peoriensis TaxID=180332 RepID=A0A4U8Q9C7_9FIRM|nr:MerR family transcriptional regulator [Robinsoniella peoriensis]TLD01602.1 HTH-type transcriptional activator TipA [Robinsoniella peoriensis]
MDRKKLIEQSFTAIDQPEMERIGHVYNPGVLYNSLGITRETLRYYEKQGLICPNKDRKSSYREFTILDIFRLMAIDYYKKHGFAIGEIKELINQDDISQVHEIFSRKQCQLKKRVRALEVNGRTVGTGSVVYKEFIRTSSSIRHL